MKRVRKINLVLALLMVLLLLLASCAAQPTTSGNTASSSTGTTQKPTIRFAHMFTDGPFGEFFQNRVAQFVKDNSSMANYVIEAEQGDNLRNKIKIDMAANNLPDAFTYWALSSLTAMIDANLLINVKDYVDISKTMTWDSFAENMWSEFTPDGGKNYYGIPTTASLDYFLYNKEIFTKYNLTVPTTYEEFLAVSKVLKNNGIIPLAVGSKGGNPAHFYYAQMYYQYGTLDYIKGIGSGKNSFICPENLKAGELIGEQVKAGVFPSDPIGSGDFLPAVALFNEGKAAMIAGQSWSIVNFTKEIAAKAGIMNFPKLPGSTINDPKDFTVGGVNNSFVITKKGFDDTNKQAALVKLMDFVTAEETYQGWVDTGAMATRNMKYDYSKSPALFATINAFVSTKKAYPNFWILMPDPNTQEIFSTAMDELWVEAITPQQVMDKVQKSINTYLKK